MEIYEKIAHNFRVVQYEAGRIVATVAGAEHIDVAIAAFEAAVPTRPRSELLLMQGSRVIRRYTPKARGVPPATI